MAPATQGLGRSFRALAAAGTVLLGALGCGGGDPAPRTEAPAVTPADLSCPGSTLGPAPLRRLTRFEYQNAIEDLFGVEVDVEALLPRDEVSLGFDNQAATLSLTDLHVEGTMQGASVVTAALAVDPAPLRAISGDCDSGAECARTLIETLGRRLMRRPLLEPETERLLVLFADDFSTEGFASGAELVVASLLQAPEFLYRYEREEATDALETGLASPWVLASRLGFLLWGSLPDAALLDAAGEGRLATAADVEREARRLLSDPRSRRGALHFYEQWLRLSDFDEVEKDTVLFRIWSRALREDLKQETRLFLEDVLFDGDARLSTLFTARYTFANARLSDFYGLPIGDPDATELVKTPFASGVPRAGILTHGALLATQAKANQTDPIHRGKFVREQLFCQIPEPPPPELVVSPPRLDPRKTTRERFSEHRANPGCAGCHELLDPVGLIFEHYDAIGQYRETEADMPVDATGYLTDTDVSGTVDGVIDLGKKLSASAEVRRCVVSQWFRYAFSRGETNDDACTLDALDQAFRASGGDLAELVVALTQTAPFLAPAPAPEPEDAP